MPVPCQCYGPLMPVLWSIDASSCQCYGPLMPVLLSFDAMRQCYGPLMPVQWSLMQNESTRNASDMLDMKLHNQQMSCHGESPGVEKDLSARPQNQANPVTDHVNIYYLWSEEDKFLISI
ncbi:hypothetical protein PoB_005700700 [Plakobranchus ocellatus]|uniref:Uncharacterized protein n=1 Tax=Plakobranchus ocellatus TaxID=259542 RepID=A0AAV4CGJ0_9GAST|nr:hypothetical protein PoB_005700700 [Plakobranchus ocellatus]